MAISFELIIEVIGFLLLVSAFSNRVSYRFNIPILLIFLGIGMAFGSSGLKVFELDLIDDSKWVNQLATVAFCFILFSGGLGTNMRSIRPVFLHGLSLATIGVFVTAVVLAGAASLLMKYSFKVDPGPFSSYLLGAALISSTDAAAVFAIMRGGGLSLKGHLQPLLEFESGSNDPMAFFLTIFTLDIFLGQRTFSFLSLATVFYELSVGAGIGIIMAIGGHYFLRIKLGQEGLYYVSGIAIVLLTFGFATQFHANGMMAVYTCGLVLGNLRFNYCHGMRRYNDSLAWLMQVVLFISLGLLVNPPSLIKEETLTSGIILSFILIFVARPVAVWISLMFCGYNWREKLFVSWSGLRGAAPIMLATFPLAAQSQYPEKLENAEWMFNVMFFMVVISILFQGSTLKLASKLLKLDIPMPARPTPPFDWEVTTEHRDKQMFEFDITKQSQWVGKPISELCLSEDVMIVTYRRGGRYIQPQNTTKLKIGDAIMLMGNRVEMRLIATSKFPEVAYYPIRAFEEQPGMRKILKNMKDLAT